MNLPIFRAFPVFLAPGLAAVLAGCHPTSRSDPVPGPRSSLHGTPGVAPPRAVPAEPSPAAEERVTCLVSGESVARDAALRVVHAGTPRWFCSERCRRRFLSNPEHYLASRTPASR
ncbi:MAG: hypothetical protein HYY93_06650 [Planctomycetes bacterium]|nr:hypothetical protein [Planctomycetota bacterium]